jgi:peroxiredoxin
MAVLVAAVVLLGALVVVNLLLTGAVVRKLRTLARERPAFPGDPGLPVGAQVPPFAVLTTGDTKITEDGLSGTLVGFFSTDCEGCLPKAPAFAEAARGPSAEGVRALAVVTTGQREPAELLAALGGDVSVVLEESQGSAATAFAVNAYPWFFLVGPEGTIAASGSDPGRCLTVRG